MNAPIPRVKVFPSVIFLSLGYVGIIALILLVQTGYIRYNSTIESLLLYSYFITLPLTFSFLNVKFFEGFSIFVYLTASFFFGIFMVNISRLDYWMATGRPSPGFEMFYLSIFFNGLMFGLALYPTYYLIAKHLPGKLIFLNLLVAGIFLSLLRSYIGH